MKRIFLLIGLLIACIAYFIGCSPPISPEPTPLKIKIYPCKVGLTLKPGEGCHYASRNDDYNFDFVFYVTKYGSGFTRVTLKTPSNTFTDSPFASYGGTVNISYNNDLKIIIDSNVAQICLDRNRSFSGNDVTKGPAVITGMTGWENCFSASKKDDGNWGINSLPF